MKRLACLYLFGSVKQSNQLSTHRCYSRRRNAGSILQVKASSAAGASTAGSSRIWEVIHKLETDGLTTSNHAAATWHDHENDLNSITTVSTSSNPHHCQIINDLTAQVANILKEWGNQWAGQPEWQTLLSKKSLLHEVEESIVALSFLLEWLENRKDTSPITLVDVCCGKGILSMLASYVLRENPLIREIIMLDKQTDINWNHILAANESADDEGRPTIQTWGGCNLNEIDRVVDRLEEEQNADNIQYALIGIHLCKLLSPSCAGLANTLGRDKCPFLCLAPCCMPRAVLQSKNKHNNLKAARVVSVRTYETIDQRKARLEANALRAGAKKRTFRDHPCYLCSGTGHPVESCSLLPSDESERLDIFQRAAAQIPCWKCGEVGHVRADCSSMQESSKPPLTLPPAVELDVSSILQIPNIDASKVPFQRYCELLATSVDKPKINVYDVGLVNQNAEHSNAANQNNWNRDRKSIYIVATS